MCAMFGFPQDVETLSLLSPMATEQQRNAVLNDVITRINGINRSIVDLTNQNTDILANNTMKILTTGTATLNLNTIAVSGLSTDDITIPHSLGIAPSIMCFMENNGLYDPVSTGVYDIAAADSNSDGYLDYISYIGLKIRVNSSEVFIAAYQSCVGGGMPPLTLNFKYYLFRETAN